MEIPEAQLAPGISYAICQISRYKIQNPNQE